MKNKRKVLNFIKLSILGIAVLFIVKENSLDLADDKGLQNSDNITFEDKTITLEADPLDDIIYSLEERGFNLTNEALKAIDNNYEIKSENNYTQYLDIEEDEVLDLYQNASLISSNVKHIYDYYNEETKTIEYERLAEVIYNNSQKLSSNYSNIFSKDDISYVLNIISEKFIPTMTPKYSLNQAEIACILAQTAFVFDEDLDNDIAATCTCDYKSPYYNNYLITFAGDSETLRNSSYTEDYLLHELYHLVKSACVCYNNNPEINYITNGLGVGKMDFINSDNSKILDYDFIEEAEAENSLKNYSIKPDSYRLNNFILDNIKLALILNKDFNLETISKQDLNHDPIGFMQNFLIDPENEKTSFVSNIKFLTCYDYLLAEVRDYSKLPSEVTYELYTYLTQLINYAQTELTRQFFNNLVIFTDTNGYDETLNNYLISLFYHRLIGGHELLRSVNNIPNEDFDQTVINDNFKKMLVNYLLYLQNKNLSTENLISYVYTNDYLNFAILSYPTILSPAKKVFLENLTNELEIKDPELVLK